MLLLLSVYLMFFVSACSSNELTGKALRVSVMEYPPMLTADFSEETGEIYTVGGAGGEFLLWFASKKNFTFKARRPKLLVFNVINGTWTEVAREFIDKKVDFGLIPLVITAARNRIVDFTFPWNTDSSTLLIPYPEPRYYLWAAIQPYSYEVWVVLLAAWICTSLTLLFIHKIRPKRCKQTCQQLSTSFVDTLKVTMSQGEFCLCNVNAIRVLASTWCLASVILVNAYSTSLTSFLIKPTRIPVVTSLEQIPDKTDVNLFLLRDSYMSHYIRGSTSGLYYKIGSLVKERPDALCDRIEECVERVLKSPNNVFALDSNIVNTIIGEDLRRNKFCRFTRTLSSFLLEASAFPLPKQSPHFSDFNRGVMTAIDNGLFDHWQRQDHVKSTSCMNYKNERPGLAPLNLSNIKSSFFVLAIGVSLSLVALIYELLFKKMCKTH